MAIESNDLYEVVRLAREPANFLSLRSDVGMLIEGVIGAGIDLLDAVQPEAMDIFEMKPRYGEVLTFHRGSAVWLLPTGSGWRRRFPDGQLSW